MRSTCLGLRWRVCVRRRVIPFSNFWGITRPSTIKRNPFPSHSRHSLPPKRPVALQCSHGAGSLSLIAKFAFGWFTGRMWVSSIVILFGAELNSEIEHQTMRDSTIEGDKPLGARGAVMADTVGQAR